MMHKGAGRVYCPGSEQPRATALRSPARFYEVFFLASPLYRVEQGPWFGSCPFPLCGGQRAPGRAASKLRSPFKTLRGFWGSVGATPQSERRTRPFLLLAQRIAAPGSQQSSAAFAQKIKVLSALPSPFPLACKSGKKKPPLRAGETFNTWEQPPAGVGANGDERTADYLFFFFPQSRRNNGSKRSQGLKPTCSTRVHCAFTRPNRRCILLSPKRCVLPPQRAAPLPGITTTASEPRRSAPVSPPQRSGAAVIRPGDPHLRRRIFTKYTTKRKRHQTPRREVLAQRSGSGVHPAAFLGGKFARAGMSPSLLGSSRRRILPGAPGAVTRVLRGGQEPLSQLLRLGLERVSSDPPPSPRQSLVRALAPLRIFPRISRCDPTAPPRRPEAVFPAQNHLQGLAGQDPSPPAPCPLHQHRLPGAAQFKKKTPLKWGEKKKS